MSDPFARPSLTVKMGDVSVMVGMPAGRDLPIQTVKSLLATFSACQARNIPCQFGAIANSAVIQWARDEVVDLFLKSDANILFWVDSDMEWEPWQFLRLLVWAKLYGVACASYPAKLDTPTFYVLRDEASFPGQHDLMQIDGLGLGFVAMRREVLEALAEKAPKVRDEISKCEIAAIFRIDSVNGHRRGEDMAFFADVKAAGFPVVLDAGIDLGHVGQKVYRGSLRDALRQA